jgi:hypothetical protein
MPETDGSPKFQDGHGSIQPPRRKEGKHPLKDVLYGYVGFKLPEEIPGLFLCNFCATMQLNCNSKTGKKEPNQADINK